MTDHLKVPGFVGNSFYYDQQIKRLTMQFMAIFTGMQVSFGANGDAPAGRLVDVPIVYGRQDRVVANIIAEGTRNLPIRPPCMSVNITRIEQAVDRYSGVSVPNRDVYTPIGGLVPTDTKVVHSMRSIPHRLVFELSILTSNTDQQWQILEQIMLLFEQQVQIQTSDATFDKAAITHVTMLDMILENNWPIAGSEKLDVAVIQFEAIAYISAPVDIRRDMIEKIKIRVGTVSTNTPMINIVDDLNDQGIPYTTIHDVTKETPI